MMSLTPARIRAASGKGLPQLREMGNLEMNMKIRQIIHGCLAVGLIALLTANAHAQTTPYNWSNTDPGGGDWTLSSNWNSQIPPEATFDESANIGNGGTAFVAGPVPSPAGITIPNGTVEIRNGGTLTSTPGSSAGNGAVVVGQGSNESHLRVLGGGNFTAPILTVNAGSADTSVQLSGNGSLTVSGNATLGRTTQITGPDASFNVGGDLTIGGNFLSDITDDTAHSAIGVVGGVSINSGSSLDLAFGGTTIPSLGDSWTLVSGSSGVTGGFSSINGPALAGGLGYKVGTAGGDVTLSIGNVLTLTVDRSTGAADLSDPTGAIVFELYSLGSPAGNLAPATWQSLADSGYDGGTWVEGAPNGGNAFGLAEARANPLGSSTLSAGQPQSIGSILSPPGLAFGESQEDLNFLYLESGNTVETVGNIEYVGSHNNLVLVVDPTTGEAVIQNQSPTDVSIGLYSIASDSGSLVPDSSKMPGVGWDSFEESGVDGGVWQRGIGSPVTLVEANPDNSTLISSGSVFDLGLPFSIGGGQDLEFEFLLDGLDAETLGIVQYGPVPSPPVDIDGDYDESGDVALGDLNLVLFNWNEDGGGLPPQWINQRPNPGTLVGLPELNGVLFNWGNTASLATVPEPASLALLSLGLTCLIARRR